MKNIFFAAAAAIVIIANSFALLHAARNRTGRPDAELALTNRELVYNSHALADDDSGVTLDLRWTDPNPRWVQDFENPRRWLDQQKLQALGFDCSVQPSAQNARRFYQRQRPRQVFVALEYDGPGFQNWLDGYKRAMMKRQPTALSPTATEYANRISHLFPMDADVNADILRARYPNRARTLIVPAVVAITLGDSRIEGYISRLNSSIHVPLPFSNVFRRLDRRGMRLNSQDNPPYTVHLRYGTLFEPWVTGVQFGK